MSAQGEIARPAGSPGDGFRADINGLRAISVLAVVAYHFNRSVAPGGYLGVDVFFVISGFLMTNIIVGRMERGAFDLWSFYGDRVRRIVPALATMCAVVALAGALTLDPWTYQHLAADVPGALFFFSNLIFASRSGYFAPAADSDWLLHTWSLAVEWQFYLTYPVLLIWFARVTSLKRHLGGLLIGGIVVSFLIGLIAGPRQPSWVFYLEPTRTWELLAGGLCAYFGPTFRAGLWMRGWTHVAGLVLIGASLALLGDAQSWPSPWTVVPVLGAALVVLAGIKDAVWARWRVVGLIGRSSYSTYIWHWPLIMAMRYEGVKFTPAVIAGGIVLCLLAGLASYWLIERRLTALFGALSGTLRWTLGPAALLAVAGFAYAGSVTSGFEAVRTAGLAPAERRALADDRAARGDWVFEADCGPMVKAGGVSLCHLGDPAARAVLVIGDSHASMIAARYAHAFQGPGAGSTFLTRGGCPPMPGVGVGIGGGECVRWTNLAYRFAEGSPYRRVVIAAAWADYFPPPSVGNSAGLCFGDEASCRRPVGQAAYRLGVDAAFQRLAAELSRLVAEGKQVVIVGPFPTSATADPMRLYRQTFWTGELTSPPFARAGFEQASADVRGRLIDLSREVGATYVEPLDGLCPNGLCPVAEEGRALYKDGRHFRGRALASPRFAILDPWLEAPSSPTAASEPP